MPNLNTPGAVVTPISQNFMERVKTAARYALSGVTPDSWFSPGQPLPPLAQDKAYGRAFDYQTGYNWKQQPRGDENISFATLRTLADSYDLLRLLIETRKDQIEKLKWSISPRDKDHSVAAKTRAQRTQDFLLFPDQEHTWQQWLRMLVEELLVLDAPTLLPRFTRGGEMYSLEILDGSTIKRVIDQRGRTPLPPDPAYQHVLKGLPSVNYTRDELVYFPRNPRINRVYGLGPVEQIIMTVNIGLRRQLSQLQYYSDGSTSDLIMSAPKEWSAKQIAEFKDWWDSVLQGNTAARRGTMFVPDGTKPYDTKERVLKDEYDEWLARIVCFAFSVNPQPFTKQMNRATAETAQQAALEEGLAPLMQWIKNLMDLLLVKYFKLPDLEFRWEEEEAIDPQVQAQINDAYIRNGSKSVDEVRGELGLDPIGMSNAVYTGAGPVMLPITKEEQAADKQAAQDAVSNSRQLPENTDDSEQNDEPTPPKGGAPKPNDAEKLAKAHNHATMQQYELKLTAALHAGLKNQASRAARHGAKFIKASKLAKAGDDESADPEGAGDSFDAALPKPLAALIAAQLQGAAEEGAVSGYTSEASAVDAETLATLHAKAIQYAHDRAGNLIADDGLLSSEARDTIRVAVAQAIADGDSSAQLAARLEAAYAFSEQRAFVIARTEVALAQVAGRLDGYRAAGVTHKEWILGADPCDECQENADAGPIPIDEAFPSGDDGAPAHPNCLCDTVSAEAPTQDDETSSDEQ